MTKSYKKKVVSEFCYIKLVEIVRSKKTRRNRVNEAYNEIEKRMKPKIMRIISRFFIPGCNSDDIYQESLFALRFKAIPDYNKEKSKKGETTPYPFDKFAVLCIRRYLSTLLKSSFQNKRKALNTSLSLNQDRTTMEDDKLFLSDIIPVTKGTILDSIEDKEYYSNLFRKVFSKLSKFEKQVFLLYIKKYSYDQMAVIINNYYKQKKLKKRIKVKSIDNALSRIKTKSQGIYKKIGEE